jgi:tetratricopeptide (TPR) repeat protein
MHLVPLSSEQKRQLVESLGRVWQPFDGNRYSLPSEIVNPREYQHASQRFAELDDETKDVLRALKLLDLLWMPSPTRAMTEEAVSIVSGTSVPKEVRDSHISSALTQGFVRSWEDGEIHPEFAYLRRDDVVPYRQDRIGVDDANILLVQLLAKYPSQVDPRTLFIASKLWGPEVALQHCESWIGAGADRADGIAAKASLLFQLGRPREALELSKELSQGVQLMFELQYLEELEDYNSVIEQIQAYFDRTGFDWRLISRTIYPSSMLVDAEYLFNHQETLGLSDESEVLTLKLANALNWSERFEDALEVWNSVLDAYPDHRIALSGKARSLHFLGDTDRAVETIWEATRQWPEDAELWHRAAQLALEAGRSPQAETAISNALKFEPRKLSYLLTDLDVTGKMGTPRQYIAKALAILEIDPENNAVRLEMARKLHFLGSEEEAIAILRPLVDCGYNLKVSTEVLSDALLQLNHDQQALDILQKHPDVHSSVPASSIMGEAFLSLKRYKSAAYWCSLAAQKHVDPKLVAHYWKLAALAQLNDDNVQDCRSILNSQPVDVHDFDVRRLKVLVSPSRQLEDDAYREACELLDQEPDDFQLLQVRAFHYLMTGQFGMATADFETMHRLEPENDYVSANLQKSRLMSSKDETR